MLVSAFLWVAFFALQKLASSSRFPSADDYEHAELLESIGKSSMTHGSDEKENSKDYWYSQGEDALKEQLNSINEGIAKNVILFIGDGMSIPTLAATRVYLAHKLGSGIGEEQQLSFEKFPHAGLSKTYCIDRQVADSACTATAYLGGVKGNVATIGVTAAVSLGDCDAMNNQTNHVVSIARLSQLAGKRTGVVTTTRLTDASPAGNFGHTCHRKWESDADVVAANQDPVVCRDLAHQMLFGETGSKVNVYLGGGYKKFLSKSDMDPHGNPGERLDGRNLVNEWQEEKQSKGASTRVVANRDDMLAIPSDTEYVLGMFSSDNMPYNLQRNDVDTPSLSEMTEAAIKLLSQNEKGFFLFVEGGLIDKAHHATKARMALDETVEFHKAVATAARITDSRDTLIVVTSDHAHTLSLSGYAKRGGDVLGLASTSAIDQMPYATLSYANGPGYRKEVNGKRRNIAAEDLTDYNLEYPSLIPLRSETHGGDDVGIFAKGPYSHLFTGVKEQSYFAHAIMYAACLKEENTACSKTI